MPKMFLIDYKDTASQFTVEGLDLFLGRIALAAGDNSRFVIFTGAKVKEFGWIKDDFKDSQRLNGALSLHILQTSMAAADAFHAFPVSQGRDPMTVDNFKENLNEGWVLLDDDPNYAHKKICDLYKLLRRELPSTFEGRILKYEFGVAADIAKCDALAAKIAQLYKSLFQPQRPEAR